MSFADLNGRTCVAFVLQNLLLAMLSRRALFTTLVQVAGFFIVCYFITLIVRPADSGNIVNDLEDNWRTSVLCPDCIPSNTESQRRFPSDARHAVSQAKPSEGHVDGRETNSASTTGSFHSITSQNVQAALKSQLSRDHNSETGAASLLKQRQLQVTPRGVLPLKPQCRDPICSEYLTEEDQRRYNSCFQKVKSYKGHPQDGQCHFMSQTHRGPVALASYPGSGNTWLRGLLETATGICTGFEFCDISMRVKGFAGENIVSGAVSVVKTHGYPRWKNKMTRHGSSVHFDSAVVLVRNPLHAIVAEWNRRIANNFHGSTVSLTSHVKSAGIEMFGEYVLICIHQLNNYL